MSEPPKGSPPDEYNVYSDGMTPRANYDPSTMDGPILICPKCGSADDAERYVNIAEDTMATGSFVMVSLVCPVCHTGVSKYNVNVTQSFNSPTKRENLKMGSAMDIIDDIRDRLQNIHSDDEVDEMQDKLRQAKEDLAEAIDE